MAVELLARPPPAVGEGRFVVVDELGEGGTAIVYLAYDQLERRWCALKAMLFSHLGDDEMRRRFNQEAETLGRFSHPHIPRLVAHAPDASPPYMVMELARRGSAMDWLREHGAMPCATALETVDQLCSALAASHAAGIVHRDVKPHNVLLFDDGVCKLTDFGIARVAENTSFTATGSQIGTFSFMAPEQRSDTKSVDTRADIYAVGATMYTLLTGRTSAELFLADTEDELVAEIPGPLRDVVLMATRYRPDERYQTIDEMRIALKSAGERLSPSAWRLPPTLRDRTPLPRSPPAALPPGRRFTDLERSLALDSGQATFVPALARHVASYPGSIAPESTPEPAPPEPAAPPPLPPEPPRWLAYGSGAGALGLVAMVLVVGVGTAQVWSAEQATEAAGASLVRSVRDRPELGATLGDDRLRYDREFDRVVSESGADQVRAALACVSLADAAVERGDGTAALRAVRAERDAYLQVRGSWTTIARTFPGSWAVAIGFAAAP